MTSRPTMQMRNRAMPRAGTRAARASTTALASVEVVFYKEILDHRGFPHRCELMRVPNEDVGVEEAIAGAVHEFETAQRVSNWSIAADGYEVQKQRPAV